MRAFSVLPARSLFFFSEAEIIATVSWPGAPAHSAAADEAGVCQPDAWVGCDQLPFARVCTPALESEHGPAGGSDASPAKQEEVVEAAFAVAKDVDPELVWCTRPWSRKTTRRRYYIGEAYVAARARCQRQLRWGDRAPLGLPDAHELRFFIECSQIYAAPTAVGFDESLAPRTARVCGRSVHSGCAGGR